MGIPRGMLNERVLIIPDGATMNIEDLPDFDNYNKFTRDPDNDLNLMSENSSPMGIAKNEAGSIFTVDGDLDKFFEYLLDGSGSSARTALASHNTVPTGIAHNPYDSEFLVLDSSDRVFEYNDVTYANNHTWNLATGNDNPTGIAVSESRYLVSDSVADKIFVYNRFSNHHIPSEDIELVANTPIEREINTPYGMSVKEGQVWVVDRSPGIAYNLDTEEIWTPDDVVDLWDIEFFDSLKRAYALDFQNDIIRAYHYPVSTDAKVYKANVGKAKEDLETLLIGRVSAGSKRLTLKESEFTRDIDTNTIILHDEIYYRVADVNRRYDRSRLLDLDLGRYEG